MKIVSFQTIKKPFWKRFLWICAVIAKVLDREFREFSAVSHIRKCLVDLCAQGCVVITLYQRDSICCTGRFINDKAKSFLLTKESWDNWRTRWQKTYGWMAQLLSTWL